MLSDRPHHGSLQRALAEKWRDGSVGRATARVLAEGAGWRVSEVICTAGPADRAFEERRDWVAVAVVTDGGFVTRTRRGADLLIPGAFLLGEAGQAYECRHEHGEGDRCLCVHYEPGFFAEATAAIGGRDGFGSNRAPAQRSLSPLATELRLAGEGKGGDWEGLAMRVALAAAGLSTQSPTAVGLSSRDERRVGDAVRVLQATFDQPHTVASLAAEAGVSPFHFLRTFRRATGETPHQHVLRLRLREAAFRLRTTDTPVTTIAYAVGFGDLSNFIRSFRAEFGCAPAAFRRASPPPPSASRPAPAPAPRA